MLNPRDMVGIHYLVSTQTEEGTYQRLVRALYEEDAVEQVVAYLVSEGVHYGDVTTQKF